VPIEAAPTAPGRQTNNNTRIGPPANPIEWERIRESGTFATIAEPTRGRRSVPDDPRPAAEAARGGSSRHLSRIYELPNCLPPVNRSELLCRASAATKPAVNEMATTPGWDVEASTSWSACR
jgi:hypothetical protein